jgi:hypothetical protein
MRQTPGILPSARQTLGPVEQDTVDAIAAGALALRLAGGAIGAPEGGIVDENLPILFWFEAGNPVAHHEAQMAAMEHMKIYAARKAMVLPNSISVTYGSLPILESDFPKHKGGLHLSHNDHKGGYETIEQWESHYETRRNAWISDEQRTKAIAADSVWQLQWYPDNPVGSFCLLACDLTALLKESKE